MLLGRTVAFLQFRSGVLAVCGRNAFCTRVSATPRPKEVPEVRRTGFQASLPRGSGGRCSFNGIVCTVFGANGFLGRRIVNRLAKLGTQIIIPYRGDTYDIRHLQTSSELGQFLYFPFHLRDENSIRKVLKYSNVVINAIGRNFETPNFSFYDVHTDGSRRIARICREMNIEKLIHFSAMNASPNPEPHFIPGGSNFLRSKGLGEIAVSEEFPDAIIIRPSDMYGHKDYFLSGRHHLQNLLGMYERGQHTLKAPVWVNDVVSGLVSVIFDPSSKGKTFEFIGPYSYKIGELMDWVYDTCNRGKIKHYSRRYIGFYLTMKTNFFELRTLLTRWQPPWSWETFECVEATPDVLTGCLTLEDLGVQLNTFEDKSYLILKPLDAMGYMYAPRGYFPYPDPLERHPHRRKYVEKPSVTKVASKMSLEENISTVIG